jgi:hypothetical protein
MGQWIKGMHNDHLPKRNQKETKWQWRRGVTLGPREKTHNHLCSQHYHMRFQQGNFLDTLTTKADRESVVASRQWCQRI